MVSSQPWKPWKSRDQRSEITETKRRRPVLEPWAGPCLSLSLSLPSVKQRRQCQAGALGLPPAQLPESVICLTFLGAAARGEGNGFLLRKVLGRPSSPACVGVLLQARAGIMSAVPLYPSPLADIPNQPWPSLLLLLEMDFRLLLTPPPPAATTPWFGTTQDKTDFPVEWQRIGPEKMGSGDREMCFACHICH